VATFNEVTNSSANKKEKEKCLKKVECILDFTLRMHNDLYTIYFETAFLQKSNTNVMLELQELFVDYKKPIKYNTAL
jgi:predicted proteasome-type protease